jgi:hypothetical protein
MLILLATVVAGTRRWQHWKLTHPIADMYGYHSGKSYGWRSLPAILEAGAPNRSKTNATILEIEKMRYRLF